MEEFAVVLLVFFLIIFAIWGIPGAILFTYVPRLVINNIQPADNKDITNLTPEFKKCYEYNNKSLYYAGPKRNLNFYIANSESPNELKEIQYQDNLLFKLLFIHRKACLTGFIITDIIMFFVLAFIGLLGFYPHGGFDEVLNESFAVISLVFQCIFLINFLIIFHFSDTLFAFLCGCFYSGLGVCIIMLFCKAPIKLYEANLDTWGAMGYFLLYVFLIQFILFFIHIQKLSIVMPLLSLLLVLSYIFFSTMNKVPGLLCVLSLVCYESLAHFLPGFVHIIFSILISIWAVWYNVIKRYGLFWKDRDDD